jgi:hypothetical protein
VALKAFEPATLGAVAPGFVDGSRFKGSVRNGLNGAVEPGFGVGSRFKASVRDGLDGVIEPGVAGCGCAARGPSRGASGWGWVFKKKGIFAADERGWTQMSR